MRFFCLGSFLKKWNFCPSISPSSYAKWPQNVSVLASLYGFYSMLVFWNDWNILLNVFVNMQGLLISLACDGSGWFQNITCVGNSRGPVKSCEKLPYHCFWLSFFLRQISLRTQYIWLVSPFFGFSLNKMRYYCPLSFWWSCVRFCQERDVWGVSPCSSYYVII